jgi:8-amino-7-oxononanoate synthase
MSSFDDFLQRELRELERQNLHRSLRRVDSPQSTRVRVDGREFLNFSSNDYLGLANDPRVKAAATEAIAKYGAGSGASRLISGSLLPHHELEVELARFKQAEAALAFSSGYSTALGAICALLGKGDVIILDKLVHASIVDAARLSGAKLRIFSHNDLNELEDILKWFAHRGAVNTEAKALVVTESVFSMDGDFAPLREIIALKHRYGAWLMVDEAHAAGLYGQNGAGCLAEAGLENQAEVQMGTLGKALGSVGGYICGSRSLIDFLVNRARSFIFSTAPTPAASAAASAALRLVQSTEGTERRAALWARAAELRSILGLEPLARPAAILPLMAGDESAALDRAHWLFEKGILVPAIRYPSVARGSARLRFTVTSTHTQTDLETLASALVQPGEPPRQKGLVAFPNHQAKPHPAAKP